MSGEVESTVSHADHDQSTTPAPTPPLVALRPVSLADLTTGAKSGHERCNGQGYIVHPAHTQMGKDGVPRFVPLINEPCACFLRRNAVVLDKGILFWAPAGTDDKEEEKKAESIPAGGFAGLAGEIERKKKRLADTLAEAAEVDRETAALDAQIADFSSEEEKVAVVTIDQEIRDREHPATEAREVRESHLQSAINARTRIALLRIEHAECQTALDVEFKQRRETLDRIFAQRITDDEHADAGFQRLADAAAGTLAYSGRALVAARDARVGVTAQVEYKTRHLRRKLMPLRQRKEKLQALAEKLQNFLTHNPET